MQLIDVAHGLSVTAVAFVAFTEADGAADREPFAWLTPGEAAYARRLTAIPRRAAWLAGRRAAKVAVSRLAADVTAPHGIEILPAANGAPLVRGRADDHVAVSISHAGGLAVAVAFDPSTGAMGIDVESHDQALDPALRGFAFSPEEQAAIEAAGDPTEVHRRTLAFWTAKEAALKAVRRGLLLPLAAVRLSWGASGEPRVATIETGLPVLVRLRLQSIVCGGHVVTLARETDR